MKREFPSILLAGLLACCARGLYAGPSVAAPGGGYRVVVETVAPRPDSDDLLPTQRLRLEARTGGGLVLVDGFRSMCDTGVRWLDDGDLYLRVPEKDLPGVHVYDGELWRSVAIHLKIHTDQILMRSPSPDGRVSLVVIRQCESERWSLYLRRAGEPDYDPAMRDGWGDPELFGGLIGAFPLLDLEWTGPRSACAEVALIPWGAKLRRSVDGVRMEWVASRTYRRPPQPMKSLGKPLHRSWGAIRAFFNDL